MIFPANQDATKESASVKHFIITDLLAIHMVRKTKQSTIITYHPTERWWATTAENLRTRTYLAGQSVYWNHIFRKSNDPTFVMLATLWYALYAWDEALETLWNHICEIVSTFLIKLPNRSPDLQSSGTESN